MAPWKMTTLLEIPDGEVQSAPAAIIDGAVSGLPVGANAWFTIRASTDQAGSKTTGKFWPALTFTSSGKPCVVASFFGANIPDHALPKDVAIKALDCVYRSATDVLRAICNHFAEEMAYDVTVRIDGRRVFLTIPHAGTFEGSLNGEIQTLAA